MVKPKRTAEENKPFIAQGLGSLAGVNGLSKGAGAKQASLEYGVGDRVRHIKYGGRLGSAYCGWPQGLSGDCQF